MDPPGEPAEGQAVYAVAYGPTYYSDSIRACFRTRAEAEAWLKSRRRAANHDNAAWRTLERMRVVAVPLTPPDVPPE